MIKKFTGIVGLLIAATAFTSVNATNLITIYQQALVNDPTFKKAQADWLTAKQNFPLALTGNGAAGSGIFPNVTFSGSAFKTYQRVTGANLNNSGNFDTNGLEIDLTQPVFNLSTWYQIKSARYVVRAATATYLAAAQDLMNRVAFAYFEVLRANERLNLTLAQQNQFKHQLDTAEQKFKVGLIAITGVYDAQASYDRSVADEIRDRNELQDRLEDLRAITGRHYKVLEGLRPEIPLIMPRQRRMNEWVRVALKQNYTIQADLNTMLSQRQNVKVAATGWLPTVNFNASYSDTTAGSIGSAVLPVDLPHTRTQEGNVGGSLTFPVFRGGFDIVNTRQASYQYLSASDQLQVDFRTVENNTRQAYLGIESGISEIRADQQAIISARNQLEATKAGYIVGTRTMVDVLDSVTQLTQTQLAYADDRYNYVEGIFNLKLQAGTLSPRDIQKINSWLKKRIKFSLTQPKVRIREVFKKDMPKVDVDLLDVNKPELTDPVDQQEVRQAEPPTSIDGTKSHDDFYQPRVKEEDKMLAPYIKTHPPSKQKEIKPVTPKKLKDDTTFESLPKPEELSPVEVPAVPAEPQTENLPEPSSQSEIKKQKTPSTDAVPSLTTDPYYRDSKNHKPEKGGESTKNTKPSSDQISALLNNDGFYGVPVKQLVTQSQAHQATASKGYSIELYTAQSKKYAERFYQAHKHTYPLQLEKVHKGNRVRYRVLLGNYPSMAEAVKALHKLPKPMRVYQPWVVNLK